MVFVWGLCRAVQGFVSFSYASCNGGCRGGSRVGRGQEFALVWEGTGTVAGSVLCGGEAFQRAQTSWASRAFVSTSYSTSIPYEGGCVLSSAGYRRTLRA